jgi:hypothetical protein
MPSAMSNEANEITTITVLKGVRDQLDELKEHRREPLYEVIQRLINEHTKAEA